MKQCIINSFVYYDQIFFVNQLDNLLEIISNKNQEIFKDYEVELQIFFKNKMVNFFIYQLLIKKVCK